MSDDKGGRRLGRGLEALFGEGAGGGRAAPAGARVRQAPVGELSPGPFQPRRAFDEEALEDLARSIEKNGVLQPLIARPRADGGLEIIAGERRWRACQLARVHEVPVLVRDLSDEEALAVALVENLQRDDLAPLEEAEAYARLTGEFGNTQQQVALAVGKSRSHVANMMRLLALPGEVRALLADGSLTAGHARAVAAAADPAALARRVVAGDLSVREAERLARKAAGKGERRRSPGGRGTKSADTLALERRLEDVLGLRVRIDFDGVGGKLVLTYGELGQLDRVIDLLTGRGGLPD